ncbi:LLM class flavin-dependent oxidoreductase [Mycobacterium sp. C31M]
MTASARPKLSLVALSRNVLAELLAPDARDRLARIAGRVDETVDALVLGADVVPRQGSGDAAAEPGIDVTIAAITLAHLTERVGLIIAVAPQRDHPYNLARRLASIDHASGGRAGVFIAARDPAAPAGSPWTAAPAADAAADAVVVLRKLWASYPVEAVVGDIGTGVFTESHRIVTVDHRGPFNVTGPLQVPSSPQLHPPVLAWADDDESGPSAAVADVVIGVGDPRFDIVWPHDVGELERVLGAGRRPVQTGGTLRSRLGLSPASPPNGGRPAFRDPHDTARAAGRAAEKVGSHGR